MEGFIVAVIIFICYLAIAIPRADRERARKEAERKRLDRKRKKDWEREWESGAEKRDAQAKWEREWGNPDKPSWSALTLKERRRLTKAKVEDFPPAYREFELGISRFVVYDELWQSGRRRPRCYLCRKYLPSLRSITRIRDQVHIDHIVPLAEGGTHTRKNVTLTHASCNIKKRATITDRLEGERGPLPSDHRLGFTPKEFPLKNSTLPKSKRNRTTNRKRD
jgi:hypothetical protein